MLNVLKTLLGGKPADTQVGNATVIGSHNRVINLTGLDGAALAFEPRIDWNRSPQAGAGLAAWLEWRCQLTPLIGREVELAQLTAWAHEPHPLSIKIIQAPGGTGKTRLAADLAQSLIAALGSTWSGGFVKVIDFERAQRLAWQGNWCLLVDYPEHAPQQLAKLMRAAIQGLDQAGNSKLRLVLLCRDSEAIESLLHQEGASSYKSTPLYLPVLTERANLELLNKALHKLSEQLNVALPAVTQPEFDAWQQQSTLHHTALFVVALALHLSTAPAKHSRFLPGAELLQALLKREQVRWKKAEEGQGLPQGSLTDVVAFASLLGGLPREAVNTQLKAAYNWSAETLSKLHTALSEVWPLDSAVKGYPAMAPDLLAAVMLWEWQAQSEKAGGQTDAQLLSSLALASKTDMPELLQRWHMQAYDQTFRLQLGTMQGLPTLATLLQHATKCDSVFAKQLKLAFQSQTSWAALADLASASSKPLENQSVNKAAELAARASDLNNYAVDLATAGNRKGALKAAQEAVEILRRLANTNPAAYEPALAMSINTLASSLSETGDRPGALKAAQEAVEILRRLAKTNPAAYEPVLAGSINNLANRLSETGDRPGALKAAQEAVEIRRRLAKTNPAAYEPDLAMSINNLANRLSETGDRPGALKAAQEAVEIRRRLAKTNPAAYEPVLAGSINNLANFLSKTGDRPGALKAAQEAVEIRRRLAKINPAAYEPDLAASINNLANRLSETGDRPGALKAAQEAVALYEKVGAQTPGAFDRELAIARRVLVGLERSA